MHVIESVNLISIYNLSVIALQFTILYIGYYMQYRPPFKTLKMDGDT